VEAGLRGGKSTYVATDAGYDFTMKNVRFTQDVAVTGAITWDLTTNLVTADVSLKNGTDDLGSLSISWNDAKIDAIATLTGTIQGAVLKAQRIAP
jgi:hypothetical protein